MISSGLLGKVTLRNKTRYNQKDIAILVRAAFVAEDIRQEGGQHVVIEYNDEGEGSCVEVLRGNERGSSNRLQLYTIALLLPRLDGEREMPETFRVELAMRICHAIGWATIRKSHWHNRKSVQRYYGMDWWMVDGTWARALTVRLQHTENEDEVMSYEEGNRWELRRTGKPPLVFQGDRMAEVSTRHLKDRWTELRLWRLGPKSVNVWGPHKYVTQEIGRSLVDGEVDRYKVLILTDEKHLRDEVGDGPLAKQLYMEAGFDGVETL